MNNYDNNSLYKYLKYKSKYINSKKLILGGSILNFNNNNNNIILCATHNNRLECYFKNINKDNDYPNKSFNNCVIIRCFKENNKTKFNMIYEGETNGDDFVSLCSIRNGCWDIISFNNYFNNRSYDINLPDNTEIFLIRHGLGVHNKMNILQKILNTKIDSQLDPIGLEQAMRAGIFLKGYIYSANNNSMNININFMASHLMRAQQTIGIIMKMLEIKKPIYISPCSHEVNFGSTICDSNISQYLQVASNKPTCTNNSGTCGKLSVFSEPNILDNYEVNLNWDYYIEFNKSNKCQDTNMVSEIINLYNLL
jgi:bisphosphoglycerate-dependent phosphoglycerate mutase